MTSALATGARFTNFGSLSIKIISSLFRSFDWLRSAKRRATDESSLAFIAPNGSNLKPLSSSNLNISSSFKHYHSSKSQGTLNSLSATVLLLSPPIKSVMFL